MLTCRYISSKVWAVGFYNEIASTEFAKMWRKVDDPDLNASIDFPEGSVVFKLLYTDATGEFGIKC